MPRKKRFIRENFLHHIMFRGVNGENVFRDEFDRVRFCLFLQESCEKYSIVVHGFCLMSNHIHLILQSQNKSLQSAIHMFAFRYAQYFNKRHERRGYLFQGRYKSIVVESTTYLIRLIRYIHLNPVDAQIVKNPQDYRWSSYSAYLNKDAYTWLNKTAILKFFGETEKDATEKLIEFTSQKIEARSDQDMITKAFQKGFLGNHTEFKESELILNVNDEKQSQVNLVDLIDKVCIEFKVSYEDLKSSNKNRSLVKARKVLAGLVKKSKCFSLEALSNYLGKNSGTLSRLANEVEKDADLLSTVDKFTLF